MQDKKWMNYISLCASHKKQAMVSNGYLTMFLSFYEVIQQGVWSVALKHTADRPWTTKDIRYNNYYGFDVLMVPHGDASSRTSLKEGHVKVENWWHIILLAL